MSESTTLLATMITMTTYGTWLPGDVRGYVEKGVVLPGNPELLACATKAMRAEPVFLSVAEQSNVWDGLQQAATEFGYVLHAVSIERWHAHLLLSHHHDTVSVVTGRLKARMRQAVGRGGIWGRGYDKRYCFTEEAIHARVAYIRSHRGFRGP